MINHSFQLLRFVMSFHELVPQSLLNNLGDFFSIDVHFTDLNHVHCGMTVLTLTLVFKFIKVLPNCSLVR